MDVGHRSGLDLCEGLKHRRHQWSQDDHVIARDMNNDDRYRKITKVLLMFEVGINRDKNIKLARGQLQQVAIFHTLRQRS